MKSFYTRRVHQLLTIRWSDHVTNKSVCELTVLWTIDAYLSLWRRSVLSHIVRLDGAVHANCALWLAIDIKEGKDLIWAGVVAQADLDVYNLGIPYQHCDQWRLPEDMERCDGLRPGDNDDVDDDDECEVLVWEIGTSVGEPTHQWGHPFLKS